jgi:hypothetical protein
LIAALKAWAREPLVHFLVIGAGVYALMGWLTEGESQDHERAVVVSAADVNALVDQWKKAWMRPPTEEEFTRMINAYVREKVLYNEAVAMGLDAGDIAIEQRLAQKVELLARGLNTPSEPGDEELREWFAENTARFGQPDLYSVEQVFFDPEKREDVVLDDARTALGRLNDLDEVPEDFATYGDRAMQQSYLPQYSELELRRLFGAQLVDEIVKLEPGAWHGPLMSGYGAHIVRVVDILRTPTPAFEEVRGQVAEQWMAERINVMSERYIDELISRYDVVIEDAQSRVPGSGATP